MDQAKNASQTASWSRADTYRLSAADFEFDLPVQIGRYQIEAELGKGGFGRVYLARDVELSRLVAIKVPHRNRLGRLKDVVDYLVEARIVAKLDHPNIVPVYDVGTTDDGLPFVVSKFIAEGDLARKVATSKLSFKDTADLVSAVADALHYAHLNGVVHRDIKPGNILIDAAQKPYLADFGLALKEEDFGRDAPCGGTPAYMSPEQARGQGHHVDGRSDIFSLGVVLYELLTGRRPFLSEITGELLEQISEIDPRPPRQIDDAIPERLESVCLRALSKEPSNRYSTARDMADDLRRAGPGAASENLDRRLEELNTKNERLRAEVELHRDLAAIDRGWQDERRWYTGLWAPFWLFAHWDYRRRRDDTIRRFNERYVQIGAVGSSENENAMAAAYVAAPRSNAIVTPKKTDAETRQLVFEIGGVVLVLAAVILFPLLVVHFAPSASTQSKVVPKPQEQPGVIELVERLTSGDAGAARSLAKNLGAAAEAVPLLCNLLENNSDELDPAPLRLQVYAVLKAYGSKAKDAAPILSKRFCFLASSDAAAAVQESQQILSTIQALGSDELVRAELPAVLAAAKSQFWCLEVARLLVALNSECAVSEEELGRVLRAVATELRVVPDEDAFPDEHLIAILEWAVDRVTAWPAIGAPLSDALAGVHSTLQQSLPEWERGLSLLESDPPPRTEPSHTRVGKRWRITNRPNADWSAHQSEVQSVHERINKCLKTDAVILKILEDGGVTLPSGH